MGRRGSNATSYAFYEDLDHLKVSPEAEPPAIYKRLDKQTHLPVEQRTYQIRIPIPREKKGVRKSLRTADRSIALERAMEQVLETKLVLKQGGSVVAMPVEQVVEKFLAMKQARVRGRWEGKGEAGTKSITAERYGLIAGKLRNYLVPFLGAKTDARSIPFSKWKQWETWRCDNRVAGGRPRNDTLKNEMTVIRECWRWAMENTLIPQSPQLPFQGENLCHDDKMRRDTWEAHEWQVFARRVRAWLKKQEQRPQAEFWDAWVAYQMLFFLANNGMRVGEVSKVKRKDIQFKVEAGQGIKTLCALVQVHKSAKTGAREVNSMGGVFAKRVMDKSDHRNPNDFLFCHLDGRQFTSKDFWKQFKQMIAFTQEQERTGKKLVPYSLRHFYATTRLQNGTTTMALCQNMGCSESYLRNHYSHYQTRLASADLMRMNQEVGLGSQFISNGADFLLPEAA